MQKWWGAAVVACLLLIVGFDVQANGFRTVQQVNSSALVVKQQPQQQAETVDTITRGQFVTVYETTGEWSKVGVDGQVGFVQTNSLVKPVSTIKIASSKSGLVVKIAPTAATKTVATLQYGMIVEDFGPVGNGWSFVQYGNVTGYVVSSFIGQPSTTKRFVHNPKGEPVLNIASPSGAVQATLADRVKVTVHTTLAGWSYVTQGETRGYVRASKLINIPDASKVTYLQGILVVNKDYPLPKNYAPGIDATAKQAMNQLIAVASRAGYKLSAFSVYRSYGEQTRIHNNYVKRDGQAAANRYSARPGHSEHQSGLAFDIGEVGRENLWLTEQFGTTAAGKWLVSNAHTYGFILRYPQGKESITGYMYEPWHFRYVGKTHAVAIQQTNVTLEEYLGID